MADPTSARHDDDVEAQTGCCAKKKGNSGNSGTNKPCLVEFRDFVLGGNLIRIAVAFVLALALEKMVSTFVSSFVTPILGIIGAREFKELTFTIRSSVFTYGVFLDAVISFLVIATVLFFCLILPVQRYGGRCVPSWIMRKCPYCFADMPAIGTKCQFCCSSVEPLPIGQKVA